MTSLANITDEDRKRISQEIEYFLEFTRDVLNDPSLLDHIPDMSDVHAIPRELRDPNQHYDIETPRFLATVTPPPQTEDQSAPTSVETSGNGSPVANHVRHVSRNDAALQQRRTRHKLNRTPST